VLQWKKKAPKKVATPAKNPQDVKAPQPVRGSKIPDSAIEHKRGGAGKPTRKLDIKRTGNRAPKREFDRHDGTGRAHEGMKKQGGGRGNWGKVTDHTEESIDDHKEEKHEEPVLTEEEKALIELREKQKTVDQYKKQRKGEKTILKSAAAVEVECSVDEKNFAPLTRVDLVAEQEKIIAAEKKPKKAPAKAEKAEKPKKAAPKKEEAPVIEINFNEGHREHREKAPKPVKAKINVDDKEAFPSLA